MKLLYIVNQRLPIEKAYSLQVTKMAEAFADWGIEVNLIAPTRRDPIKQDFFSFYSVRKNFKFKKILSPDFYFPGKLDKIAVAVKSLISALVLVFYSIFLKTDIVYSRDELPLYFLSFFKKNLIFEAHRFSKRRSYFYKRFKNRRFKVVVISNGLKDEFIDFGFKPENILAASDGVDLKEFDLDLDKNQARFKLGLPENKKLIGYVGQLKTMGMEKGIDLAIKSLKLLPEDVILVLVGGNKEDLDFYKELAVKKGLKDRIVFTRQVNHNLIPVYLKSFDVLLMPFPRIHHYEFYMSPLKLFEYMASHRPIVANNLTSIREVLNEKNSVLIEPESFENFASGIRYLLDNKDLADKLANQAFDDVKNYTWYKRAENILEFIKK